MKSGKLNFLEPSGPFQACNGIALPFLLISCKLYYVNRDQVFIISSCSTKYFLFSRMHHQPSVTGIQARHEALHSSFDVDGRHWQAPGVTLTTPRSPKPPVSRTTANDGRDANVIADDPEFAHKAWEYIRSQLLRL